MKKIAVANGLADGEVRALPTDNKTLTCNRIGGTLTVTLYGQKLAEKHLVADMTNKIASDTTKHIIAKARTNSIPELDGAPGGTLQSNHLAVQALAPLVPNEANRRTTFPWVCFVPTVSAVDVADPGESATHPIPDDPPEGCGFDKYRCATAPAPPSHENPEHHPHKHTLLTEELCTWLLEHFE